MLESSESDSEMHSETYSERDRDRNGNNKSGKGKDGRVLQTAQSVKPVRSDFVGK